MKTPCVHCGRPFEVTGDFEASPGEMFSLGPDCFRRLTLGSEDSKLLIWNAKGLAKNIFAEQMKSLISNSDEKNQPEEVKMAIAIKASLIAWYSSFLRFSQPGTREAHLKFLHESSNNSIDIMFDGLPSIKKMNEDLYAQFLEKSKILFDPNDGEAFRELIGQVTGTQSEREKSVDDYLWDEFSREVHLAYPYALSGTFPQSPSEMIMVDQFFHSLQRSFMIGTVGVDPNEIAKNSVFDPFVTQADLKIQSNILSDGGLGAQKQSIYVAVLEQTLLGNAFLKTGKNDTFEKSIEDISQNLDMSEDDRETFDKSVAAYKKRVASEKMTYADPMGKAEVIRARSINEYAILAKSLKDVVAKGDFVAPSDPAVIALAPMVREIEEMGAGTGVVLAFGGGQPQFSIAKTKGYTDPFQKACAIFKERTGSKNQDEMESSVDEQSFVVLVNGDLTDKDGQKQKRTIAYIFEKNVVSKDMAQFRSINTSTMPEEDGKKLGLVITESWEMPHDRVKNIYIANLRSAYDRAVKTGTPSDDKDMKFFNSRYGRLADTMSAHSFEVTGSWLKHMPGPNPEERSELMKKLDPEYLLANAIGKRLKETYKELGFDPKQKK